jgi:hypothetical protein
MKCHLLAVLAPERKLFGTPFQEAFKNENNKVAGTAVRTCPS